jgi:predicted metal-dependent peptidase
MAQDDVQRMISASLLRLRMNAPFFAALSLFATFRRSESIPTAATDGKIVYYNADFLAGLSSRKLDGLLLHEVLHAALLHAVRRGTRDRVRWNIAADVVVNGVVAQQPFLELPDGGIRAPDLENLRVEEIYELLSDRVLAGGNPMCLHEAAAGDGPDSLSRLAELETYWERALRQAEAVSRMGQGNLPAGMDRLLDRLSQPQLDWRSALWRFLVRTPADFGGFDRRLLSRKLYLETLEGEGLRAYVAIDTSGSIGTEELALFLGEVRGILGAYPHINAELYYADAELHGPFDLEEQVSKPTPKGGGGTSFVPFFRRLEEEHDGSEAVCLYLTDGYGTFPDRQPDLPTLWVVTPGGLPDASFPFGDVVRLLKEA